MQYLHKFIYKDLAEACEAAENKALDLQAKVHVFHYEVFDASTYFVTENDFSDGTYAPIYIADYSGVSCSD